MSKRFINFSLNYYLSKTAMRTSRIKQIMLFVIVLLLSSMDIEAQSLYEYYIGSVETIDDFSYNIWWKRNDNCVNSKSNGPHYKISSITDPDKIHHFEVTALAIPPYSYRGHKSIPSHVKWENKIYPVTSIAKEAFKNCPVTRVDIPYSVHINSGAFSNNIGLLEVHTEYEQGIADDAFDSYTYLNATLYVPAGKKGVYQKLSGWKEFRNIKEEGIEVFVSNMTLNYTNCEIIQGQTIQLSATISPDNATSRSVTWSSDNTSVATVDNNGLVRGVGLGRAVITCAAEDGSGVKATCNITVKAVSVNNIQFADANVKSICLRWDTNGDGELSMEEAASATDLGNAFYANPDIISFNELQYFTGLHSIGANAFYNCSKLSSVILPQTITSIDQGAFSSCSSLTSISIPESVTSIERCAFYQCSSLKKVVLPETIKIIEAGAFSDCPLLTNIAIPEGVTEMGFGVFQNCSSLKSIRIPNKILTIRRYSFYKCTQLKKVELPATVDSIGNYAFFDCSQLEDIEIPSSVKNIGYAAFFRTSIKEIDLPETLLKIAPFAFQGCSELTSVHIPGSIDSLEYAVFSYCKNLTNVELGSKLKYIGGGAFWGCPLKTITIPSSVREIEGEAFGDCTALETVTSFIRNPFPINENVFMTENGEFIDPILFVPYGTAHKYRTTQGWSRFTNIIEMEKDDTPTGIIDISSKEESFDIYDLSGKLVKKASFTDSGLPKGIYIKNGKKYIIK